MNKEIINAALVLSIITALFYFHGTAFHQGYLRYWGLRESLFPITFEQTLLHGSLAYNILGAKVSFQLIIAFGIVFFIGFFGGVIAKEIAKGKLSQYLKSKRKTKEANGEELEKDNGVFYDFQVIAALGFVLSITFLLLILVFSQITKFADKQGFDIAKVQHEKIKEGDVAGSFSRFTEFDGKNLLPKGFIIECSKIHCAVLRDGDAEINDEAVIIVNISNIEKMKSPYVSAAN